MRDLGGDIAAFFRVTIQHPLSCSGRLAAAQKEGSKRSLEFDTSSVANACAAESNDIEADKASDVTATRDEGWDVMVNAGLSLMPSSSTNCRHMALL